MINWQKLLVWAGMIIFSLLFWGVLIIGTFKGCANAEELTASWYGEASLIKEGTWKNGKERRMANGEHFDERAFTCANRLFPLGSILRVTDIESGKSVIVRTTDRIGKRFARRRIDLSKGAFAQIADCKQGIVLVKVEILR